MKKTIFYLLFFINYFVFSQQQLNFGFAESPQTLLLNPGAETNFNYHYGLPFLSNLNFDAGSTSFNLGDLFLDDGISFTDKLKSVVELSDENDFFNINVRNDILFGGFRLDEKSYVSFGFYQELDFIFYMPNDILELGLYGNATSFNRNFSFSHLRFKATTTGVLHAGVSKKINKRLNIGARAKIYSSSANVETNNNSGTLTTFNNPQNIIRQTINNLDVDVKSAGLFNSRGVFLDNPRDIYSNTFLGGNFGLGFDVGFTYHFTPDLELTASAIDIGFIRYKKDTRNFKAKGNFVFDGINFEFDPNNPRDYWDELEDEFDEKVPTEENQNAYTSLRPLRLNVALKYGFGEIRPKSCYTGTRKVYHSNSIGFQLHSVSRPGDSQYALTSFFENSFSENFHLKFTHTFNNYSDAIFGAALAFQWRTLNFVGVVDNISQAANLETADTFAFSLGINFVIK